MRLAAAALFTALGVALGAPVFQRGVNFTSESGYAPAVSVATLDKLKSFGVNAIALVPYGFERKGVSEIRFVPGGAGLEREDDIQALIAAAHERGIRVLLKPQIWVPRGFPGDLEFPAQDRSNWFKSYERFILHFAALAARAHADLFAVGVELVHMSSCELEWRTLIGKVRQLYRGPLVYAANCGPDFEDTRFWDALDYIGLNEYYPLPDDLSTAELIRRVGLVQQRYRKPVILTEVGFASLSAPHRAPWDETSREIALDEQARCYEAVFRAFYKKPWFQGMYWWKVGNTGFGGPANKSFTPWGKPAMEVVRKWYLNGGR